MSSILILQISLVFLYFSSKCFYSSKRAYVFLRILHAELQYVVNKYC